MNHLSINPGPRFTLTTWADPEVLSCSENEAQPATRYMSLRTDDQDARFKLQNTYSSKLTTCEHLHKKHHASHRRTHFDHHYGPLSPPTPHSPLAAGSAPRDGPDYASEVSSQ